VLRGVPDWNEEGMRMLAIDALRNDVSGEVIAPGGDRCVGVAGWRVTANTAAIRKLYVDDLVTRASERSRGIGALLLTELTDRAKLAGCQIVDLDSGVQRGDAHRFYMREGLTISSFHFVRPVS
jgi:GNAT superfamily N-acetyltransferase